MELGVEQPVWMWDVNGEGVSPQASSCEEPESKY